MTSRAALFSWYVNTGNVSKYLLKKLLLIFRNVHKTMNMKLTNLKDLHIQGVCKLSVFRYTQFQTQTI
jgi:hypothetical protein